MFPRKDSVVVPFSANFAARLGADASGYHVLAEEVELFDEKALAFTEAYNDVRAATAAGIRSGPLCARRDSLKTDLLHYGRYLYAKVQFSSEVSDAMKLAAGVHVRKKTNTPQPNPEVAPGMVLKQVDGRVVTVRLFDAERPTRKGRPPGIKGAVILSHIGNPVPDNLHGWTQQFLTGDLVASVTFPESTPPGTPVHVRAYWFNNRKAASPVCLPVSTVIGYPATLPAME